MADALVSGSSEISRVGSSPISCTNKQKKQCPAFLFLFKFFNIAI